MFRIFKLSLLTLVLTASAVHAQNCSVSQTKGVYSALATGNFFAFPPPLDILAGPTVRIGRVEGSGKGDVRIQAIASLNGFVFSEEYDGFLTVNPNCTTIVSFLIPLPGVGLVPFQFRGVLSDNFQQHDIILETIFGGPPASTVTISLRRQSKSNCANRDLKGGYVAHLRGFTGLLSGSPKPYVSLGRVVFDGAGTFAANTYVSDGSGPLVPNDFSGTYAVTSSCDFTMSYNGNTWAGVLNDNSTAANLMVSVPNPPAPPASPVPLGMAIGGTLKRQ
jgi:hypothetical protein